MPPQVPPPHAAVMSTLPSSIAHQPHRVCAPGLVASAAPYKIQNLTGQVTKDPGVYMAYGGLSDIYRGEWTDPDTGKKIPVSETDSRLFVWPPLTEF
jgi:hypothetical protein